MCKFTPIISSLKVLLNGKYLWVAIITYFPDNAVTRRYDMANTMNISIIGYGNMAKAIAQGLLQNPAYHLQVSSPSLPIGQSHPRCQTHHSNLAILPEADVLILAVKPIKMAEVLAEIRPQLRSNLLLISVAAGLSFTWFQSQLPPDMPLVRAMPNIAAACGQSATPLVANAWVNQTQQDASLALFSQCGRAIWTTKEADLDAFTALSGSGLAYIFAFAEAMRQGGITLGLDPTVATTFAVQTLQGAAQLATDPTRSLQSLQDSITSKAGTTAAALDVFAERHLSDIVLSAMQAAVVRSQTLREELCQD
ncbi:MAG: pyrroline-5-carboxylate reductase [Gammaproteobacteria bacterium]|nr:pyrroline-5-carboxylate reductase [Gammaproteobacteria bacterium]